MYINICKWCDEKIEVEFQQKFASHVSSCKKNPNLQKRREVLQEFHRNRELKNRIYCKCSNCEKDIIRKPCDIKRNKSSRFFCNSSCAAKYNNTHRTTGTRRSKMEVWIEYQLKEKYDFEIIFNRKEAINSELDIYVPSLNLAFELNGIFHYEPIYGNKKLNDVKNNDGRKFQACLENNIELCIIDTSGSKKFKPERDKKYLDIIFKIIESKLMVSM